MEASWWEMTFRKLVLVLMGGAMLSKSLIQFSVDQWGCVPLMLFDWDKTMMEVMKIMTVPLKRSYVHTATLRASYPVAGHFWPASLLETVGQSQVSLGQSLVGHCFFSWKKNWKTQQWPQDWKMSVFIPIPKKGNAKECSNYHTIALISHTNKVMLKILQARLR